MERTIIQPMEQMRDFDFVSFEHDVLVALGGLAADVASGMPTTFVGGLVGSQTVSPTLSINISAGRIYQLAPADAVAAGSIPQDLGVIVQQGYNPAQTLTLTSPSAGQSQWNVIQAQFSQTDAVRAGDPNGGIVPFYNAANPTQPTLNSINTVRKGLCVLQVITGSAATTGSEVPPSPTGGWVPLYMIDLAGGQTSITTSQIIPCGPSVGPGVPSNYPVAPFLAGLLASHHSGALGQAPKIKLASEVQGVLPYVNMSPVRTLLNASLTIYVSNNTGLDTNAGLTPATAVKTIQRAVDIGYHNYDFNGQSFTVSIANGSYAVTQGANQSAVIMSGMPLGCPNYAIVGNAGSPGSVALSVSGGSAITVGSGCSVSISGMSITAGGSNQGFTSFSGYGLNVGSGGYVQISNMAFGTCGSVQVQSGVGSTIVLTGPASCTGTTLYSFACSNGGTIYNVGNAVTVTGLTVTAAFITAQAAGSITWFTGSFIGTATGSKYLVAQNGIINTNGAGVNYFPGSVAGTTASGGVYV